MTENTKSLEQGICAARGFQGASACAHIKPDARKDDLALIYSQVPCSAAGVFTRNLVQADCVKLTRKQIQDGTMQAVIVNSGNANAAAQDGYENALRMAQAASAHLHVKEEDVVVASTGVIGQRLNVEAIEETVPRMVLTEKHSKAVNVAIMTTDTRPKEFSLSFELDGKTCYMGGIAKGSGMIHPNMGTMLCFITTDAAIDPAMLQQALDENVETTFNSISVDQDTSTNDMCIVLANGLAENPQITSPGENFDTFKKALHTVMESLAVQIAADGEGASRLVSVIVENARNYADAKALAISVITSSLVKAAMFGADANCGRILCALGYAGVPMDPSKIDVSYVSKDESILVCQNGLGLAFDEEKAARILKNPEVTILVNMNDGSARAQVWGCDLTYDYVKINGDYRT